MKKVNVAFICVHNSCRSQMAEAIGKMLGSDVINCYSAGTVLVPQINKDAVRIMRLLYDVDISAQKSKLIDALPKSIDIVVTMGCNVSCPFLPCKLKEDWGLEDPSGKSDNDFVLTAKSIEEKMVRLILRIKNRELNIE